MRSLAHFNPGLLFHIKTSQNSWFLYKTQHWADMIKNKLFTQKVQLLTCDLCMLTAQANARGT